MRHRAIVLLAVCALVLSACSDDDGADTSTTAPAVTTTSTTRPAGPDDPVVGPGEDTTTTTTSTTTTTIPLAGEPLMAREGDDNETVEALQFLLNCSGADLTVDGAFGPGTRSALESAQEDLGVTIDGVAGDQTFTALSRACTDPRPLDGDATVVGNAAPGDPGLYTLTLVAESTVRITAFDADLVFTLSDATGTEAAADRPRSWTIVETGDYQLGVDSPETPINYSFNLTLITPELTAGAWILATDGISFGDTELGIGDNADTVIDHIFEFLGHGVRGAYREFDTDWYVSDDGSLGLRGIFIEGLAFLFFGPHPGDPDRAETLVRVRFEGHSDDAEGQPRPDNYITTAEGLTVGDTLTELQAAYGSDVRSGSNAEEHYYRFTNSGGELCFYFGSDEPEDLSEIVEIATECRD